MVHSRYKTFHISKIYKYKERRWNRGKIKSKNRNFYYYTCLLLANLGKNCQMLFILRNNKFLIIINTKLTIDYSAFEQFLKIYFKTKILHNRAKSSEIIPI